MQEPLFELGRIRATLDATDVMATYGIDLSQLLERHVSGDWGRRIFADRHDTEANAYALKHGLRIKSAYEYGDDACLYVITEADRSQTTIRTSIIRPNIIREEASKTGHTPDQLTARITGHLKSRGLEVLDHNWMNVLGGLPLVACDRRHTTLIVYIVRIINRDRLGLTRPESEARGWQLRRLAVKWMKDNGTRFDRVRVDVITYIKGSAPGEFVIEHTEGIA